MEWIGLLILYAISGFIKKRQQNKNRKIIESDPSWDSESISNEDQSTGYDQLFNDLFESNPRTPKKNSFDIPPSDKDNDHFSGRSIEMQGNKITHDRKNNSNNEGEENIYQSKLADKKELYLGKKWNRKIDIKNQLFESKKSIKKSIIIKELLSKPLGMRN